MAPNPAHEQTPSEVRAACETFREDFQRLRAEIGKVIVGHNEVVEGVLMALFAGGNVLLEGVPGLGKTLLVRTLAQTLDLPFNRVQFTPDLMPADVIGTNIVTENPDTGRRQFEFQRGPIFAQIVLADEINRATPKTQSALLEAMQEHAVTVGGVTYRLDEPFLVNVFTRFAIYALAAVMYFAVTGPMPQASASRVMHDSLPPLGSLQPPGYQLGFLEAIDRGLSIRPERRPR
ncbi:MAG TPA: AAA family ATPase, partial [Phycisphaerales bacterium]|nr:AAA family ATPase [Phycisphaerales bacterium]